MSRQGKYLVCFDPLFSPQLTRELQQVCASCISTYSLADCLRLIQQRYPCVKQLTAQKKTGSNTVVYVSGLEPLLLLSDALLLEHGVTIAQQYYQSFEGIYSLIIPSGDCDGKAVEAWFRSIDHHAIFDRYAVVWIDKTRIILTDKESQSRIVITAQTQVVPSVALRVRQLIEQYARQVKKKSSDVIADMRFKNQIIVYCKRGDNEGECIFS
jgi:hypothetical protein